VVTIALSGDHGKPRSALVILSDLFDALLSVERASAVFLGLG
jgi:hypothetical protein